MVENGRHLGEEGDSKQSVQTGRSILNANDLAGKYDSYCMRNAMHALITINVEGSSVELQSTTMDGSKMDGPYINANDFHWFDEVRCEI